MQTLPPGFILINKPVGWTSFDVVGYIRKGLRKAHPELKNIKVGHAGTLDPFATGLLIVGIGRGATKQLDQFKQFPKTYRAIVLLGATSDTQDNTGVIKKTLNTAPKELSAEKIKAVLKNFIGQQNQVPPMHSAKQIGGVRLYTLARQGKEVERKPVAIEIYDLTFISYTWPDLTIEVTCSAGTYIRTLANDIGAALATDGYCEALERIAIGEFKLADAMSPEALDYSQLHLLS